MSCDLSLIPGGKFLHMHSSFSLLLSYVFVCSHVCVSLWDLPLVILCSSISVCHRAAASVWTDHSKTGRKEGEREKCVSLSVFLCANLCWWWFILWMCIFERCSVFCLYLICPFSSLSPPLFILSFSLLVSPCLYPISSQESLFPHYSLNQHTPTCQLVCVRVWACPLSKVVKYSKDRDLF